ncbi:MAG: 4-hydroxy-tetrahydrodipicolinate reductase [Bacteroidota bacterium]
MGKLIEQLAKERGHEVVLIIDADNQDELQSDRFKEADVAIEFSTPQAVLSNINAAFTANVPIVVGTTGWYDQLTNLQKQCAESNNTLLYASNFSVGVNVFFQVNRILAKLMNRYPQYEVQLEEIHHTQKLDAPSGTAITIAEGILDGLERKNTWVNELVGQEEGRLTKPDELLIESHRIDQVPGTHTVIYSSEVDEIEFKHTAHNRAGFALGAILAAEWLEGKRGFYSINDLFDFK